MKSRDINPLVTADQLTPPPGESDSQAEQAEVDDWGGSGQVPISVSEGDFSTPTKRTRTITRPRGLKTLEQLAEAVAAPPAPEEIPPSPSSPSPGHEASVVDEFLAAPPTPAPEVDETPPLEADSTGRYSEAFEGILAVSSPDSIENAAAANEMRQAALLIDRAAAERLPEDESGDGAARAVEAASTAPIPGLEPDLEKTVVDNFLEPAASHRIGPVAPPVDVLDIAAIPPIYVQLDPPEPVSDGGDRPLIEIANQAPEIAPEELQEITAQEEISRPLADEDVRITAAGLESRGSSSSAPEPALSPLAQALAHMAEAMQTDLALESEGDIDIADGPLVPVAADTSTSGRSEGARARAVPPPPPSTTPADGGSDSRTAPVALVGLPEALIERPRRPKRSKPWFEEVFDESYLRTLPFMTAEQTLREVDFIESSLAVPKGAEVLDVGCGYGRHAIELVQRGLAVTGLDLSLPLLIRAADESQRRSVSVNFVHTDMREIAFERQFAGAYCMLTSFGYFDEESNLKVAEGIARALKPGGRFLLDVINRDYIVGDLPARVWWEGDGCVVLEETDFNFNTNRIVTHRSVVFEDGQQLEHEISVRVYSLHDLGKLLRQAGFRVIEVSGSIPTRGHFFGATSRNLLILAERRSE